jgi:dihydroorotase
MAAPGMLGLQTAVPVTIEALAAMTTVDILALLSWRPARICGLAVDQGGDQGGPIAVGMPANVCVIDPTERWEVDPDRLASRSRNTPWAGRTLTGRVRHTVYRGEPVVVDAEATR